MRSALVFIMCLAGLAGMALAQGPGMENEGQQLTHDAGNGLVFYDYTAAALWDTIGRANRYFEDTEHWEKLMRRAMACDFSWERAVKKYEAIYRRALEK